MLSVSPDRMHTCGLFWLPTTVQIVAVAMIKLTRNASATTTGKTMQTLVLQRSRIAGGRLAIPLDATIALIPCSLHNVAKHTIEIVYGTNGKRLRLRASSALQREKWMAAIATAVATPLSLMTLAPAAKPTLDMPKSITVPSVTRTPMVQPTAPFATSASSRVQPTSKEAINSTTPTHTTASNCANDTPFHPVEFVATYFAARAVVARTRRNQPEIREQVAVDNSVMFQHLVSDEIQAVVASCKNQERMNAHQHSRRIVFAPGSCVRRVSPLFLSLLVSVAVARVLL